MKQNRLKNKRSELMYFLSGEFNYNDIGVIFSLKADQVKRRIKKYLKMFPPFSY
jgi:hypothetical protein